MALIDVRCSSDHISEVYRAISDWPNTPVCPECGGATEQIHLPKSVTWNPDPVIVFQAKDGSFRFPGDNNGRSAKTYERQGLTRIEIKGAAEMRRFEGVMNKHEYSRAQRRVEHQQQQREARFTQTRGELRRRMQSMSEFGRDLARTVMRRNDDKPRERVPDSGFHSEVYNLNRSNRDESRGSDGRRRRD